MTIIGHISLEKGPNGEMRDGQVKRYRETALPTYGRGADGYGRKIPTRHMVMLAGERHWRRVYVCQISNAGTVYIQIGKDWVTVED